MRKRIEHLLIEALLLLDLTYSLGCDASKGASKRHERDLDNDRAQYVHTTYAAAFGRADFSVHVQELASGTCMPIAAPLAPPRVKQTRLR